MGNLVTVVTPCYNSEKFIVSSINSVLSQTYKDFELILIDDGSTDSTPELLNNYYGKIKSIILKKNCGVSSARNIALSKSDSDWVAFLDHDAIFTTNDWYLQLQQIIKDNPRVINAYFTIL